MSVFDLEGTLKLNGDEFIDALDEAQDAADDFDLSGMEGEINDAQSAFDGFNTSNIEAGFNSAEDAAADFDLSAAEESLGGVSGAAGDVETSLQSASDTAWLVASEIVENMGGIVGAAVSAVESLIDVVDEYQQASVVMAQATGATGEALDELNVAARSAYYAFSEGGLSMKEAEGIAGALNTRFGLTGEALTDATIKVAQFSKATGSDGVSSVQSLANVMNSWNLNMGDTTETVENMDAVLNDFTTLTQMSQVSVDTYSSSLSNSALQYQAMGLSLEDSMALLGAFGDLNTETAGIIDRGLRTALTALQGNTDDVGGAMTEAFAIMASGGDTMDILNTQVGDTGKTIQDVFGANAAGKIVQAMNNSQFSVEKFQEALANNSTQMQTTAQDSMTLKDKFDTLTKFFKLGFGTVTNASAFWSAALKGDYEGVSDALGVSSDAFYDWQKNIAENLGGASEESIKTKDQIVSSFAEMGNSSLETAHVFGDGTVIMQSELDNLNSSVDDSMDNLKSKTKDATQAAKDSMNFSWSLPHLKLPHFSASGQFSLNPLSIPHFSVEWYSKAMDDAMVLNGATIFGAANGQLLGGGEVGAEVISGEDHLIGLINESVGEALNPALDRIYELLAQYLPENGTKGVYLDGDALVGAIGSRMNEEFGAISARSARGM